VNLELSMSPHFSSPLLNTGRGFPSLIFPARWCRGFRYAQPRTISNRLAKSAPHSANFRAVAGEERTSTLRVVSAAVALSRLPDFATPGGPSLFFSAVKAAAGNALQQVGHAQVESFR